MAAWRASAAGRSQRVEQDLSHLRSPTGSQARTDEIFFPSGRQWWRSCCPSRLLFLKDGQPVRPDPARLNDYVEHAGSSRGVWPSSPEIRSAMIDDVLAAETADDDTRFGAQDYKRLQSMYSFKHLLKQNDTDPAHSLPTSNRQAGLRSAMAISALRRAAIGIAKWRLKVYLTPNGSEVANAKAYSGADCCTPF